MITIFDDHPCRLTSLVLDVVWRERPRWYYLDRFTTKMWQFTRMQSRLQSKPSLNVIYCISVDMLITKAPDFWLGWHVEIQVYAPWHHRVLLDCLKSFGGPWGSGDGFRWSETKQPSSMQPELATFCRESHGFWSLSIFWGIVWFVCHPLSTRAVPAPWATWAFLVTDNRYFFGMFTKGAGIHNQMAIVAWQANSFVWCLTWVIWSPSQITATGHIMNQ